MLRSKAAIFGEETLFHDIFLGVTPHIKIVKTGSYIILHSLYFRLEYGTRQLESN